MIQPESLWSAPQIFYGKSVDLINDQASDLRRCSRDRTRTYNLPVNSRLLCQLSYAGSDALRI
ncbi:hypothetical protein FRAAL5266 [Frankia alni ACN14a]|uniref:Uncharacterized protein n=1 Tax=Frankia alni (strain DSM 45986 / CECT 9034 / ACN14a) TaxID=326424 RepID=Q0RF52_FRAAA|nr:hypothetical protein FRAAL5266 [Frankia alni ACN14a]